MGLSAPKNRNRISADPQNTNWAHNTSRFGHRILSTQGWTPGSSLGAKNASHAAHYTAGSHSHIRVLLKADNLGLGAQIGGGSERAEKFGLNAFNSILARLNGKTEDVKKQEEKQEEIVRRMRYTLMNFVSGGYLVGDEVVKEMPKEGVAEQESVDEKPKKRKRKADADDEAEEDEEAPRLKRKKNSMDLRAEAARQDAGSSSSSKSKSKKEKKDKKKRKEKASSFEPAAATPPSPSQSPEPAAQEELSDKAKRKAEKRARKEEKKLKKALKRAAKEAGQQPTPATSTSEDESTPTTSVVSTGTSTPSGLTFSAGGRHAVRQRYIQQKKRAAMDPQALKEIFMMKTPA